SSLIGLYIAVLTFFTVSMSSCSKEETQADSPAQANFTFHVYVVPIEHEKNVNKLDLLIWVNGQKFSYSSKDNEIFHRMKVQVPSKLDVSFEAKTDISATFHFRAYQDEQYIWGGGNSCPTGSYSKYDKLSF